VETSGVGNSGSSGPANSPQQQTAAVMLQIEQLHASLAVASQDARGSFTGGRYSQTQGQFVNVSA
jgi:hypothetical protein